MGFKFTPTTIAAAVVALAGAFGAAYSLAVAATSSGGATVTSGEWLTILGTMLGAAVAVFFHDNTPTT